MLLEKRRREHEEAMRRQQDLDRILAENQRKVGSRRRWQESVS